MRVFASAPFDAGVRQGVRDPMEGWFSPNYGCMEPAPAVVFTTMTRLPVRFLTILCPAEDIDERPDVQVIHDVKGRLSGLTLDDHTVTFDDDEMYVRYNGNH